MQQVQEQHMTLVSIFHQLLAPDTFLPINTHVYHLAEVASYTHKMNLEPRIQEENPYYFCSV